MQATDRSQERLSQGLLLPSQETTADPPPEDPAFQPRGGRGMDELALHKPPCFGHAPIVNRQPIAGPQSETEQVEPAGLVDRALPPTSFGVDERFPDTSA